MYSILQNTHNIKIITNFIRHFKTFFIVYILLLQITYDCTSHSLYCFHIFCKDINVTH